MKKINGGRRCRLCACEEDCDSFFNIFDENSELELEMKITKLLPVVVMPWDPMPHTICNKCIDKLNSFNDFYDASLKAERFLRTLHPSAPESERETLNPVVQVLDHPILSQNSLKLPPKKRQGHSGCAHKAKKEVADSSESVENPENLDKNEDEIYSKKGLNCFIINQITNRDSILTCRECCRTFTKKSSALTHSCVRIEDCGEVETIDLEDDSEKSLPPLKIRLFSVKSGLFVCYLCQTAFEDKKKLVEHIKEHFLDGDWGETTEKKKPRGKRKGRQVKSDEDGDWEETYKKRAAKRKRSSGPQRRGRSKAVAEVRECQNGICVKCGQDQNSSTTNTPPKETVESTTQYSDKSDGSEAEVEIKDVTPLILNPPEMENWTPTKTEIEKEPSEFFTKEKTENNENSFDFTEIPKMFENDTKSDEVTIVEVVNNKSSTSFSSCVFCDKIFATKDALIIHQNKHLQGYSLIKSEAVDRKPVFQAEQETFLCSICAMIFTNKKTLLEHEQFHLVDYEHHQRKIRIALGHEFPDRDGDQECQISKGRGFITITVTSGEKKIPQIELI